MPFNQQTRTALNVAIPAGAAGLAGIFLYNKKEKDVKVMLFILLVVFLLVWLVTSQVTKTLLANAQKPGTVPLPNDTGNTGNNGNNTAPFDPGPLATAVFNDTEGWTLMHDTETYRQLNLLSNTALVQVYNYWNDQFYGKHSQTIVQAIDGDTYYGDAYTYAKSVNDRFKGLGLH